MIVKEIRADSVVIEGYVNAVDRISRPINHKWLGRIVERVLPNVFSRAISRGKKIKALLNHDNGRELANTEDGTLELIEDAIGLKARFETSDAEVVQLAKDKKLQGWSFGFNAIKENLVDTAGEYKERQLEDIDLDEVSIIDNTLLPIYAATSVETRADSDVMIEIRTTAATDMPTAAGDEKNADTEDVTDPDKSKDSAEIVAEQQLRADNALARMV